MTQESQQEAAEVDADGNAGGAQGDPSEPPPAEDELASSNPEGSDDLFSTNGPSAHRGGNRDGSRPRGSGRESPLGDLASRLLRVGAEAVNQTTGRLREAGEDVNPREILSGAVRMTAKGREELVGLVAKEVRMYLEKLRVGEELRALMTDHSLELSASVRLKPIADGDATDDI